MASHLIIKSRHPFKQLVRVIGVLVVIAAISATSYFYGVQEAYVNNDELRSKIDTVTSQLSELKNENRDLREKNAELNQSISVDKSAYANVDNSLKQLQQENLELKEEVTFYRGIVSPKEAATGLNITNFEMIALPTEKSYRFKLVLTQVKKNDQLLRGKVDLFIDGIQEGKQTQLDATKLMGNRKQDMNLRFKYFQNIEGNIVLPDGFVPSSVVVDIRPSGRNQQRITKTFVWSEISS